MHRGLLTGAIALLVVSLSRLASTTVVISWLLSVGYNIGTIGGLAPGKSNLRKGAFWGGVAFHGVTAIAAPWLFLEGAGGGVGRGRRSGQKLLYSGAFSL